MTQTPDTTIDLDWYSLSDEEISQFDDQRCFTVDSLAGNL